MIAFIGVFENSRSILTLPLVFDRTLSACLRRCSFGKLLLAGLGDGAPRSRSCSRPDIILRGPVCFRTIAVRGQARARDQVRTMRRLRAFGVGIQLSQ